MRTINVGFETGSGPLGLASRATAHSQEPTFGMLNQSEVERPNYQSFDQSNGICFAELTVQEKS